MRRQQRIDADWRFHLGDASGADFMGYDDSAWRQVTLPHDWAVEHPFDKAHASGTGYLPGGTAWYRKHFILPEEAAGKLVRLTFQGIYKHAKVWINSNYLGQHAYGYTSFSYDISEFLHPGENVIAVRVEHNEVADSRWYTGSGITRHVLLTVTDPVSFAEYSPFVSTESLEAGKARLRIRPDCPGAEELRFELLSREGVPVASAAATSCKENSIPLQTVLEVENPIPWSPDRPYLYTLKASACACGQVTDTVTLPVGIRVFRFDPNEGFFLNGVSMKLKGVCVHHDAGCLGAAVPKNVWKRRLERLKEAGCNALRTAHNPPDPDLLDLCDELGFLVMDEAFDEWEGTKNKWWQGHNVYPPKHFGYAEDFPQWHAEDLRSMVLRDRNHPSIVLWSIGNEIDYPNDPYVTPVFREVLGNNDANKPLAERLYDARKPDAGRLAKMARELTGIVHALDDTRPVTSALSFPELSNRTGYADALDLSGYNYREHFYEEDHAKYPDRVILGSENSHDPKAWRAVTDHDYISGQFLWTGIDFLGECQGWPLRISQAGMLNLAGFEKPLFDQRKALWTKPPFARLSVGSAGGERHGVWEEHRRWEGTEGEAKIVSCLTNEPEAELFLNDVSLGKKTLAPEDGCRLVWECPYTAGILRLKTPSCEDTLSTVRPARALQLTADCSELPADGLSVVQVEAYLVDEDGRPAADEVLHAQPVGSLRLMGMENGRPDDLTPYTESFRRTLDGRLILYLRAGNLPGPAGLHIYTGSGLTADLSLSLRAVSL